MTNVPMVLDPSLSGTQVLHRYHYTITTRDRETLSILIGFTSVRHVITFYDYDPHPHVVSIYFQACCHHVAWKFGVPYIM